MTPKQLRDAAKEARALAKVCLDAGDKKNAVKCIQAALRYEALIPEPIARPDWTDAVKALPKDDSRPFVDDEYFLGKKR